MPRKAKPVWILCPRCELNYIKKADKFCDVCKKEMKLIAPSEDDIGDLELCPICKQELGIEATEDEENQEIADWHKYISDDDEEDEEDEDDLTDDVYDKDEVGISSGMDEFDFGDDIPADIGEDISADIDDDDDLDMIDDDEDEDDDFDDDDDDDDDDF